MREIVLDTETTGLDAAGDDRIIEIGCVELINYFTTGNIFHVYINPERNVPIEAENVHGISTDFLKDKPLFKDIADDFFEFIKNDTLVIHNASFDIGFLNAELKRIKRPSLKTSRVTDTLALARRKHPAGPNSLDALCKRYNIDNSNRTKHGALLDSELLAEVYLELSGQRQANLELSSSAQNSNDDRKTELTEARARQAPLQSRLTKQQTDAHEKFLKSFKKTPIWRRYLG